MWKKHCKNSIVYLFTDAGCLFRDDLFRDMCWGQTSPST